MSLTPAKAIAGISGVAIPIFLLGVYWRPSYSNLINKKLKEEQYEASRNHNYKTDVYVPAKKVDWLLSSYGSAGRSTGWEVKH